MAVRNRLSRGTLRSTKENKTVYVLLPADMSRDAERDASDTPTSVPRAEHDMLTSTLRDRLRYDEEQLEAERRAHAEARRIIAGLVERLPQLEAPQDTTEAPQDDEQQGRGQSRSDAPGVQEGVRRPWWRRWFGS